MVAALHATGAFTIMPRKFEMVGASTRIYIEDSTCQQSFLNFSNTFLI